MNSGNTRARWTARALNPLVRLLFAVLMWPTAALAQEGINTEAATEPSTGVLMIREQVRYESYSRDPTGRGREVHEWRSHTMLSYGVTSNFALNLTIPIVHREIDSDLPGESDTQSGVDDMMLMGQLRLWTHHFGPVETARFSLMFGAELPSCTEGLSSDTVDPMAGGVFTLIYGRHGGNLALRYQRNSGDQDYVRGGDGEADAIYYDTAYLYRIAPAKYSRETGGAWYVVMELNGLYETNGDNELLISPGIMFEGQDFAIEASVQLPLWQRIDHRPRTDFTLTVGLRFLL